MLTSSRPTLKLLIPKQQCITDKLHRQNKPTAKLFFDTFLFKIWAYKANNWSH